MSMSLTHGLLRAIKPDWRQCTATSRATGERCAAWACYDSERCRSHGGVSSHPNQPTPCTCSAYQWPHRRAGGWCCWPLSEPLVARCTIPPGTRSWCGEWRHEQRRKGRRRRRR
jgi:hypothetical protein